MRPKRQHWVPCGYLQFFAINGDVQGRNSQVYFTDGKISKIAPVKDLAVEKFTYSRENLALDHEFNEMEKDLPSIIRKILKAEDLRKKEYYSLIIIMCDLNLRSVAFENRTDLERFHVYEAISKSFNQDMYADAEGQGNDLNGMIEHLKMNWELAPICSETGEKFITSDNPSMILTDPKDQRPVLIYLPIHPQRAVIAYDKRSIKMTSGEVTIDALRLLNGLQINLAVRHVFSDYDIMDEPEDWEKLKLLTKREKPERWIDEQRWKPGYISIASPVFNRLTFLVKM